MSPTLRADARPSRKPFLARRSIVEGIGAVEADTAHSFGRHMHDHFGIGFIERGAQRSASGRGPVEAGPGDVITVNPGEIHDGMPIGDDGRAWRMLYLDTDLVAKACLDVSDGKRGMMEFTQPVITDAGVAFGLARAYATITGRAIASEVAARTLFSPAGRRWPEGPDEGGDGLKIRGDSPLIASSSLGTSPRGGEEGASRTNRRSKPSSPSPSDQPAIMVAETWLLETCATLLLPRSTGAKTGMPATIRHARALIDDDPASLVSLSDLADASGLSRYQVLRAFSRWLGLTPHAYILQRRLNMARRLIGNGVPLAEAAAVSGFADQAHMTRLFVRFFGISPGVLAAGSR